MLAICGAWSAPMCWLYVVLGVCLCVLAICGARSTPTCWLYKLWGAWRATGARGE